MDLGIYPLNTSRFVLGADPIAVTAMTSALDEGFALLFPDDTVGSSTASFDAYPGSSFSVLGTEGRITIEPAFDAPLDRDVGIDRGDERIELVRAGANEVVEQLEYFATCVRRGVDSEPNGADGLADLRILNAAYESAETGARIDLE
jgi:xylose dehydrogenase (NAD/NADP)